ncbi:MAG: hypothetical protein ACTSXH_11230 [Promethearchaeota archaeon]
MVDKIIKQSEVDSFLIRIKNIFPNCIAGIICDHHGFPISSQITDKVKMKENELALLAISNRNTLNKKLKISKIKLDLDAEKKIKLLLLIKGPKRSLHGMADLRKIVKNQIMF